MSFSRKYQFHSWNIVQNCVQYHRVNTVQWKLFFYGRHVTSSLVMGSGSLLWTIRITWLSEPKLTDNITDNQNINIFLFTSREANHGKEYLFCSFYYFFGYLFPLFVFYIIKINELRKNCPKRYIFPQYPSPMWKYLDVLNMVNLIILIPYMGNIP